MMKTTKSHLLFPVLGFVSPSCVTVQESKSVIEEKPWAVENELPSFSFIVFNDNTWLFGYSVICWNFKHASIIRRKEIITKNDMTIG